MVHRTYPYLLVSLGLHLLVLLLLLILKGPQVPEVRQRRVVIEFSRSRDVPRSAEAGGPSQSPELLAPSTEPLSGSLDLAGPRTLTPPSGRLPGGGPGGGAPGRAGARAAVPTDRAAAAVLVPEVGIRVPPPDLEKILAGMPAPGNSTGGLSSTPDGNQSHGYLDSGALEWRGRERKVLKSARPEFPEVLLQEGQEVDVEATFAVAPNGQVSQVDITRSSGYSTVDRAVERALINYLFEASSTDQQDTGRIKFRFRLERTN